MRLLSVNVGLPAPAPWRGRQVETGIFKRPTSARVAVRRHQLEGDGQADLAVHGGEFKAVYGYSAAHYAWWERELGRKLEHGSFGENLTVEGFDEEDVCVGDAFSVGTALLEAVQPRLPCFKLGIRFGDAGMVKRFVEAGRWGVYFRVLEEGELGVGDEVRLERRDPARFPVPELARLHFSKKKDRELARRALSIPALPPHWRKELR